MTYKELYKKMPKELMEHILDFIDTSKEKMNNVIQELNDYNYKIEEYWGEQEQEWHMSDWQITCRRRWDPQFANRADPRLLKNIHQFLW
jgi:hypothetical protein